MAESEIESQNFKRNEDEERFFLENLLNEQNKEDKKINKTTNVELICPDGCVPAHAFVLQSASTFFCDIFNAQGPAMYLLPVCPVILPDYNVSETRKLVEFIYTGKVSTNSDEEAKAIKEMIEYFGVKVPEVESIKDTTISKRNVDEENGVLYFPFDKKKTPKENLALIKKPIISITKTNPIKVVATPSKPASAAVAAVTTAVTNIARTVTPSPNKKPHSVATQPKPAEIELEDQNSDHSESEAEQEIDDSIYTNKEWFLKEAKKCQSCNAKCSTAAQASICLTSHNRLRCYFCFKVVKNTEKLFEHFSEKHKKAGRENSLLCPICETIVPFKSVSCHVISLHLSENKNTVRNGVNNYQSVGKGRPSTITAPSEASAAKKPKIDDSTTVDNAEISEIPIAERNKSKKQEGLQKESLKNPNQDKGDVKKSYIMRDLVVTYSKNSICSGKRRVMIIRKTRT